MKTKQIINIIIFSVITVSSGWLGLLIDKFIETPPESNGSLGMLVWLVLPLLTVLILRGLRGDGWKDFGLQLNFKDNIKWYLLSIGLFPVLIAFILVTGKFLGVIAFDDKSISVFFPLFTASLAGNFLKNIFEEFAWRGYLNPKLDNINLSRIKNHLYTGLIWALWHLPYFLFFIKDDDLEVFTGYSRVAYVFAASIAILVNAIVYGEIRLITKSIWPLMLLHTVGNALTLTLILENFITIKEGSYFIFGLGLDGLIMFSAFLFLGIFLYKKNYSRQKAY